jgi:enamine deaminase RidA (YjgF/YER057c/UK114 family)
MIVRSDPPVGYLSPEMFEESGFTQTISAGSTTYLSGIAPLTASAGGLQAVSPGNMADQITFVLDVLERCLEQEQLGLANVVATTIYVTDIEAYMASAPLLKKRFGDAPPTSTLVEVRRLAHPEQLVEITATAAS